MTSPPLDIPALLARFAASELEVAIRARGEPMPAAEALQKELWRQRRALISFITDREPASRPTPAAAFDRDQQELFG